MKSWMKGDMLGFIVNKKIAGLAEVTGGHFYSEEAVWSNGIFPFRIPIKFIYVLDIENRVPISGQVRDAIMRAWGMHYGFGILNKQVLPEFAARTIVNEMQSRPNALAVFQKELLDRIKQEKIRLDQLYSE